MGLGVAMGRRGFQPRLVGYRAERRMIRARAIADGCDILGRRRARIHNRHPLLDEIILEHVGRHWCSSMELYRRVVDDYGAVCERVFYRRLVKLRDAKELRVVKDTTQSRRLLYAKK